MDLSTLPKKPVLPNDEYDELGGIEGLSGNAGYDSNFHGIVNLCGAVGDQDWIIEDDPSGNWPIGRSRYLSVLRPSNCHKTLKIQILN